MIIGVDLNETYEYISQYDKGEKKTIFVIKTLSNKDKVNLLQNAVDKKTGNIEINLLMAQSKNIFKNGVVAIKNLSLHRGAEAKDYNEITDDIVDVIPFGVVTEVAGKVAEFNFLSGEEEKN